MQKYITVFSSLLVVFTFTACTSVDVTRTYNPGNACTGNTVTISAKLDQDEEEVNLIQIKDRGGNLIAEERDTRAIIASDVLSQAKIQYRVRVKKEIDWWPDYDETFRSNIILYDNPTWSDRIAGTYKVVGDIEMGEAAYAGSTTVRDQDCVDNCMGNTNCIENCPMTQGCTYEWDPFYHSDGLVWRFHENDFSGRLRVLKVENLGSITIEAMGQSVAGGDTANFGENGLSIVGFSVGAQFSPPKKFECDTVSVDMLCTNVPNQHLTKEHIPQPEDCIGRGPEIKLYMQCTE
jgi:hypothetical protein